MPSGGCFPKRPAAAAFPRETFHRCGLAGDALRCREGRDAGERSASAEAAFATAENQNYPVTALERGDVVDMRVQQIQQGYYTDLIQVRQSVQERQGGTPGTGTASDVYRVEGTIASIDTSRGMFTLNMTQGGTVPVYLPSNASTAMRDRLRDYRAGDYVRVEIRPIDEQNAQLVRWGWS